MYSNLLWSLLVIFELKSLLLPRYWAESCYRDEDNMWNLRSFQFSLSKIYRKTFNVNNLQDNSIACQDQRHKSSLDARARAASSTAGFPVSDGPSASTFSSYQAIAPHEHSYPFANKRAYRTNWKRERETEDHTHCKVVRMLVRDLACSLPTGASNK